MSGTAPATSGFAIKLPSLSGDYKVLSTAEARSLRERLIDSYLLYADMADDAITWSNRKKAEAHIWSTMEREDAGVLADIAIERGMQSGLVAQAVRGMVATSKYVKAAQIVGPRAVATLMHYAHNGGITLWL